MNISLNAFWTNTNNFIGTKITESLTPIQKKVAIIAISIFALAAVVYLFTQFVCKNLANTESGDLEENDIKDARFDPSWINDHPNTPLRDLGLDDYDKLKDYINEHGTELKCLNLSGHQIDNDQFEQLIKSCPNLTHLFINSPIIEDNALEARAPRRDRQYRRPVPRRGNRTADLQRPANRRLTGPGRSAARAWRPPSAQGLHGE